MITGTWALPVKRHLSGPAPGWTDYENIHILNELEGEDERLILTHESSHVWLNHDQRCRKLANQQLAAVASEVEIARCIYTPEENEHIEKSFSIIKGGITAKSYPEMPSEIKYLEEVYKWLEENNKGESDEEQKTLCISCQHGHGDEQTDGEGGEGIPTIELTPEEIKALVGEAKELVDQVNEQIKSIPVIPKIVYPKVKRSFIASELEAANNGARKNVKSFARPNRRAEGGEEFKKGVKRTLKKPKVIIYLDRSGSFTPEKTAKAQEAVQRLINRYEATVESTTLYFTNGRIWDKEPPSNGDTPYGEVVRSINELRPVLAIVVTDDDNLEYGIEAPKAKTVVVPIGCKATMFAQTLNLPEEHIL